MPLIYGEGRDNAMFRLKEEIDKRARNHDANHLVTTAKRHHSECITRAQIGHLIESLKDRDANLRRNQVAESFDGTFGWIFDDSIKRPRDSFFDWLKSDSASLYWIVGEAGSCKSTLMKFLLDDPRTQEGLLAWKVESRSDYCVGISLEFGS